jgi:hypothetical protein
MRGYTLPRTKSTRYWKVVTDKYSYKAEVFVDLAEACAIAMAEATVHICHAWVLTDDGRIQAFFCGHTEPHDMELDSYEPPEEETYSSQRPPFRKKKGGPTYH